MKTIREYRQDIVEIGKEMYDRGLLVGTDGNISIRIAPNEMLITASGFCKGRLTPEQITRTDLSGRVLEGLKPARDIRMHLAVYQSRPEIRAVVHAHPPVTTGYAMSAYDFEKVALPEVLFTLKQVAVTDYTTPTTAEVPREVKRVLLEKPQAQAVLLTNHGALTLGEDVFDAFYKMETLEMFAKANIVSQILGNTRYLNERQLEQVNRLIQGEAPDDVVR